jgi:hypothetical protein
VAFALEQTDKNLECGRFERSIRHILIMDISEMDSIGQAEPPYGFEVALFEASEGPVEL